MYIKQIKISNFKSFKEIKFDCNANFNVIIGENNIGKSTLFEAFHYYGNIRLKKLLLLKIIFLKQMVKIHISLSRN